MAGTVTPTYRSSQDIKWVQWDWTSDSGGAANGTLTRSLSGQVMMIVTDPDGGAVPTDNYDVVINDEHGLDVAAGYLANRDTANVERVFPTLETIISSYGYGYQPVFNGKLELQVTNAGNAKKGVVRMYYR